MIEERLKEVGSMPNKAAKERKQKRRELNDYLMKNGRTPNQIKRIKKRRLGKK